MTRNTEAMQQAVQAAVEQHGSNPALAGSDDPQSPPGGYGLSHLAAGGIPQPEGTVAPQAQKARDRYGRFTDQTTPQDRQAMVDEYLSESPEGFEGLEDAPGAQDRAPAANVLGPDGKPVQLTEEQLAQLGLSEGGEAAEKEQPKPSAKHKAEDVQKALTALRRDGMGDDLIEQLKGQGIDALVELGLKRAQNQADVDRKFGELNGSADANTSPEQDPAQVKPTGNPAEVDVTQFDEFKQFAEAYGDEPAKDVAKLTQRMLGAVVPKLMEAAVAAAVGPLADQMLRREMYDVRSELSKGDLPMLKKNEAWAPVQERAFEALRAGVYGDADDAVTTAVRDAAFAEHGQAALKAARAQTRSVRKQKRQGQPVNPTARQQAEPLPKSASLRDRQFEQFINLTNPEQSVREAAQQRLYTMTG